MGHGKRKIDQTIKRSNKEISIRKLKEANGMDEKDKDPAKNKEILTKR